MRIYLEIDESDGFEKLNLRLVCSNCKHIALLKDFVSPDVRPKFLSSLNVMRLIEYIGKFSMYHLDCKMSENQRNLQ